MGFGLTYDVSVVGMASVNRALAGIEKRFAQHNRRMLAVTGGAGRPSGASQTPAGQAREQARLTKLAEADQARAAKRLETEKLRAEKRVETERKRAEQRVAAEQSRATKRAETERLRAERAVERARLRAAGRVDAVVRRIRRKRRLDRIADIKRARAEEQRAAVMALRDRQRFARTTAGRIGSSVGGALRGVGVMGGAALSIGGGFAAAGAVRAQVSEQARASDLANQAKRPELKGQLLKESRQIEGFTGMEALNAAGAFVDLTGNLDIARKMLPELSRLALATGTSFDDLAAAAGNAFIPLSDKIKDPQKQLEALMSTMQAIAGQGQVGAVEIKDLATEMAGLAATTNLIKGDPAELLKTVGAMAQAARQRGGASSAAEAVTSVVRFMDDLVSKEKGFQAGGIQTFADNGKNRTQLRAPEDVMVDMLKKTGGDLGKISELFGVRGRRAVAGFAPLYSREQATAALESKDLPAKERRALKKRLKSGEFGEKAVRAEFKRLLDAELSKGDIARQSKSRLEDEDLKMKEAMKAFNTQVGTRMVPLITKLLPKFEAMIPLMADLAEGFVNLVSWFADNPMEGLGALVLAKVGADLASAGIGEAVKRTIAGSLGAPGGVGGGGPGGGKLAAGGLGLGLGLATATFIVANGVINFKKSEADIKKAGSRLQAVRKSTDLEFVRKQAQEARAQRDKEAELSPFETAAAGLIGLIERLTPGGMVSEKAQPGRSEAIAKGLSTFVGARQPVSEASQTTFLKEIEEKELQLVQLENLRKKLEAAGASAEEMAAKMAEASRAMGMTGGPNRGNAPSPVKG